MRDIINVAEHRAMREKTMGLTVNEMRLGLTEDLKEKIHNAVGANAEVLAIARPMRVATAGGENVVLLRVDGRVVTLTDEGGFMSDVKDAFLDYLINAHEDALVALKELRKQRRLAEH
jgi:hypothetical protein